MLFLVGDTKKNVSRLNWKETNESSRSEQNTRIPAMMMTIVSMIVHLKGQSEEMKSNIAFDIS